MADPRVSELLCDMGISLIDPAPALASMIENLGQFRSILRANPPAKRRAAYEALKPHLAFEVPEYEYLYESTKARKKRLKRCQKVN